METNEISSKKEWTFKRVLRVSLMFAILYAFISLIPFIISNKGFNIVLNSDSTLFFFSKAVTLSNSLLNIFVNILSFFLFVIIFLTALNLLKTKEGLGEWLCNKEKEGNQNWIDTINFFYGFGYLLWAASTFPFLLINIYDLHMGVALLLGSIYGIAFLFSGILIGVLLWIIKHIISKEFWAMIERGILSGLKYFWRFLIK
jgi:hypothetical protein